MQQKWRTIVGWRGKSRVSESSYFHSWFLTLPMEPRRMDRGFIHGCSQASRLTIVWLSTYCNDTKLVSRAWERKDHLHGSPIRLLRYATKIEVDPWPVIGLSLPDHLAKNVSSSTSRSRHTSNTRNPIPKDLGKSTSWSVLCYRSKTHFMLNDDSVNVG